MKNATKDISPHDCDSFSLANLLQAKCRVPSNKVYLVMDNAKRPTKTLLEQVLLEISPDSNRTQKDYDMMMAEDDDMSDDDSDDELPLLSPGVLLHPKTEEAPANNSDEETSSEEAELRWHECPDHQQDWMMRPPQRKALTPPRGLITNAQAREKAERHHKNELEGGITDHYIGCCSGTSMSLQVQPPTQRNHKSKHQKTVVESRSIPNLLRHPPTEAAASRYRGMVGNVHKEQLCHILEKSISIANNKSGEA